MNKPESREYVEAVPGPAIVISRAEYERMQQSSNAKENQERLARFKKEHAGFFGGVKKSAPQEQEEEEMV